MGELSAVQNGPQGGHHYQRMFAYMAGVPLSEYIRRRRMSRAAVDLQAGERVVDVALKYGYQSPTAFNRAFQSVHGLAPSAVRESGAAVKSFPPLRFTFVIKGAEEMEYRMEKRDSVTIRRSSSWTDWLVPWPGNTAQVAAGTRYSSSPGPDWLLATAIKYRQSASSCSCHFPPGLLEYRGELPELRDFRGNQTGREGGTTMRRKLPSASANMFSGASGEPARL